MGIEELALATGAAGAALAQIDALEPAAREVTAGDGSQEVADGQEQQ